MIRLLLLWCLFGQDANWPSLPPALQQNAEVVLAYQEQLQSKDLETRKAAAQLILAQLPQAGLPEQADFALALVHADGFPLELLPASIQRIHREWPGFPARVEAVLRSPEAENQDLIAGAIYVSGLLHFSTPSLVESVAARLNQAAHAGAAREALEAITRHQFTSLEAFHDWWKDSRDLDRIDWIAQALDQVLQSELEVWRRLLAVDPNSALGAIEVLRKEVRSLGYEALARIEVGAEAEGTPKFQVEAFRKAFDTEGDVALRVTLLNLVPRFFQGQEAIAFLEEALASPHSLEREGAARLLQEVLPAKLALESTVKHLQQAYQPLANGHAGTPVMRESLLTSLLSLAQSNPGEIAGIQDGLDPIFNAAFEQEQAGNVRPQIYRAVGLLGGDSFYSRLLVQVSWPQRSINDRQEALDAVIQLAQRFSKVDELLDESLATILSSADAAIRYKATKSVRNLERPKGTLLLLARLQDETDESIQRELLKASRGARAPGALDLLLKFQPPAFWGEYRDAFQVQIGNDAGLVIQAVQGLADRKDWELAWRLVKGFQAPAETAPEVLAPLGPLQARVQAEWVLVQAPPRKTEDPEVMDAFQRLKAMRELQPVNSLWPDLEGRLRTMLGQHAQAFHAFSAALAGAAAGPNYDRVALGAVRAAEAAGLKEEGAVLVAALNPLASEKAKAELANLSTKLTESIAEATGPELEQTPPPAPPEPEKVDGEGSGAEGTVVPVKPEPAKSVEPGTVVEPTQDPESGKAEKPATEDPAKKTEDPGKSDIPAKQPPEVPKTEDPPAKDPDGALC